MGILKLPHGRGSDLRECVYIVAHCRYTSSHFPSQACHLWTLFLQSKTSARIYPTYHTAFDTFGYVDKFVDPGEDRVKSILRLGKMG